MITRFADTLTRCPARFLSDAVGLAAIAILTLGILHLPAFL